jgi:DNA polymerase-4
MGYHRNVDADRVILHVDMDAFFAAIAQRDDPTLRGRPVLTGGDGPRGVVSTASYEARAFGCRSAMPMAVARRLCPQAVVARVSRDAIRQASSHLFTILDDLSPLVQPVSVDEAFVDLTGSKRLLGDPVAVARDLKQRIRDELQLTASIGVAFNKFLAKLASDLDKPDGLTVITPTNLHDVLHRLPVSRLWGVGPAMQHKLESHGLRTIGDIARHTEAELTAWFGSIGEHVARLSRGLDDRPVVPDREAKSIGQEETFPQDIDNPDEVRRVLLAQCEQVGHRLRKQTMHARGVGIKIRFGDFQTITRQATLDQPTDLTDELWLAARRLFDQWTAASFQPVRLIGVTAHKLSASAQLTLFPDAQRDRLRRLDRTLDTIATRFGRGAVHRGPGK